MRNDNLLSSSLHSGDSFPGTIVQKMITMIPRTAHRTLKLPCTLNVLHLGDDACAPPPLASAGHVPRSQMKKALSLCETGYGAVLVGTLGTMNGRAFGGSAFAPASRPSILLLSETGYGDSGGAVLVGTPCSPWCGRAFGGSTFVPASRGGLGVRKPPSSLIRTCESPFGCPERTR